MDSINRTVLLVDDDSALREGLTDILEDAGWTVIAVGDLAAARVSIAKSIDTVISDATLPDGNGVTWALELHAERPELKIILMTGLSESDLPPIPSTVTLLTKPVDPSRLFKYLQM